MAYDRKDECENIVYLSPYKSKCTEGRFSYLDDIPLKVASSFVPLPSVSLPTVLTPNEELYFEKFQYDFSLENKVLEDIKKKEQVKSCDSISKIKDASNQDPVVNSVKPSVQNILSLQSDILLPKPKEILDKVTNTDNQNNPKINLSDFENDTSSPFDYVLLQSLNDIEELYNVFGVNNKSSSDNNVNKDKKNDSSSVNDNKVGCNFSKSMSFPLPNSDAVFENSEKYMTYPKETADAWNASLTLPKENCFVPSENIADLKYAGASESLSRTFKSSMLPEVPFIPSVAVKNNIVGNCLPVLPSQSILRGCKSYSDIHDLSEHSEKLCMLHGRPNTPPTSAYSEIEDSKSSSLSVQVNETSGDANCDNSLPVSGLSDPYNELPEDSQKFVDAIADMGFSRAQISRTVKHLGTDEKAVVEHLCQIQTLEESGYDCLEAEAALHLHDYNQDQAKQFLDLIIKFQDLGFEKNAVKKALIQNKNDWSKTIDALLS